MVPGADRSCRLLVLLLLLLSISSSRGQAQQQSYWRQDNAAAVVHNNPQTTGSGVLAGWGVTDHSHMSFHAEPREMQKLGRAFKIVRTDFRWDLLQLAPGSALNFSAYDRLLHNLDTVGARPLWIIDRPPKFVDGGNPPTTAAAVAAFSKFTAAALSHFRGRGVVWELWK